MPLHLIKLCVGADSLDDLRQWMAARMREAKRRRPTDWAGSNWVAESQAEEMSAYSGR